MNTAGRKHYIPAALEAFAWGLCIAERLLATVSCSGISADDLMRTAAGRLHVEGQADGGVAVRYAAGQYYPVEYRRAVCALLAQALRNHVRETETPAHLAQGSPEPRYDGMRAGDWPRARGFAASSDRPSPAGSSIEG